MESLIDRRCAGCIRDCDSGLYYKCAQNDYSFYKRKKEEKSKYFSKIFEGWPEEVEKELNIFFEKNSNVCPYSFVKINGNYGEKICLMVVFERV